MLEQAHQRVAWVHDLSGLSNFMSLPSLTPFGNVVQQGLQKAGPNTMSVQEEVASLLSDLFPNADRVLITSVVSEQIERYERHDDPFVGPGIFSENILLIH
jgi:hypothetical protein